MQKGHLELTGLGLHLLDVDVDEESDQPVAYPLENHMTGLILQISLNTFICYFSHIVSEDGFTFLEIWANLFKQFLGVLLLINLYIGFSEDQAFVFLVVIMVSYVYKDCR